MSTIDRPQVDVDTLKHETTETHHCSIEGEITRRYYQCPNCDCVICERAACPECLWFDEDVWSRTLDDGGASA